jgi:hypothetical protein
MDCCVRWSNNKKNFPSPKKGAIKFCPYCGTPAPKPQRYVEIKTYLHSCKDTMHDIGAKAGLTGTALNNFHHALCEVEVVLKVDRETGKYEVIKIEL